MCEICQDKANGVGQLGNLQVKVCGLTNVADAIRAESAGANYGGMILSQGFGRSISLETVTKIVSAIKMPVVPVLVNEDIDTAEHLSRTAKAAVIQLHGKETSAYVQELAMRGDWSIWKAIAVKGKTEVLEALAEWEPFVDGIVLDGWSPGSPGGTGTKFAWEEIGAVRDKFSGNLELIVAGGLNHTNVRDAVGCLRPDAVDVSSGVESRVGKKDGQLMELFMRNARSLEHRQIGQL